MNDIFPPLFICDLLPENNRFMMFVTNFPQAICDCYTSVHGFSLLSDRPSAPQPSRKQWPRNEQNLETFPFFSKLFNTNHYICKHPQIVLKSLENGSAYNEACTKWTEFGEFPFLFETIQHQSLQKQTSSNCVEKLGKWFSLYGSLYEMNRIWRVFPFIWTLPYQSLQKQTSSNCVEKLGKWFSLYRS